MHPKPGGVNKLKDTFLILIASGSDGGNLSSFAKKCIDRVHFWKEVSETFCRPFGAKPHMSRVFMSVLTISDNDFFWYAHIVEVGIGNQIVVNRA